MTIKIVRTWNSLFIPKRRFLFFWYQVSEFEFHNKAACLNWLCNTYVPNQKKCKRSTYRKTSYLYKFYPDNRDKIDVDFM